MPLPKALAARLAKRGLLKLNAQSKESNSEKESNTPVHEEIIAEDYDESPQTLTNSEPSIPGTFDKYQGWYACPNKWNVYHECSPNCQEMWKNVKEIDKEYNRKRLKMLAKYPLIEHWQEILDVGIGRFYYWNTETNLVSWLPPGHPKCQVSLSASNLRQNMLQDREQRVQREKDSHKSDEEASDDEVSEGLKKVDNGNLKSDGESDDEVKDKRRDRRERDRTRERKGRSRRNKDADSLDPMDPAAYSDCPRGNWSSGLQERNEARTGVDTTATGPLFQMRPYPSPGAVLRGNASGAGAGPNKPS